MVIVLCFLKKHSLLVLVVAYLAIERKKATDKKDPRSHKKKKKTKIIKGRRPKKRL